MEYPAIFIQVTDLYQSFKLLAVAGMIIAYLLITAI